MEISALISPVNTPMNEAEVTMNDGTEIKVRFATKEGLGEALLFLLRELSRLPIKEK